MNEAEFIAETVRFGAARSSRHRHPDNSPEVAFLRISVERAVVLRRFGFEGWEEWHPSVSPNLADPGNVEE